jgi:hypothetical protein
MIRIKRSPTADTRTCNYEKVTKSTLSESSKQHIQDVGRAIDMFSGMLDEAAYRHDSDKLTDIDTFHANFIGGFKDTEWWDRHRNGCRHHFPDASEPLEDVNLIDVLELIADRVMAGLARAGKVYRLEVAPEVLYAAFQNTVDLLMGNVEVEE